MDRHHALQYQLNNCLVELENLREELIEIFDYHRSKRWRNRQFWMHPMNDSKLYGEGFYGREFQEIKLYPKRFKGYTRMDLIASFDYLRELVGPLIAPKTNRITDISAEQRLAMTIRFLATGDQVNSIAEVYKVGESTLYGIINSTCEAIYNISKGFESSWNLPHCLGAIDGKHIHIQAPAHSGSLFFNYKKTYSIILMAACNHRYEFSCVDVGSFGGESDGGVFGRSDFGQQLQRGTLPIPRCYDMLPGASKISVPYFFIGDDAFALRPDFLKPYAHRNLTEETKILNYRVSRARNCIECAFGILVSQWEILKGRIGIHPNEIDKIVLACVCLHNYLMSRTQCEITSEHEDMKKDKQHRHFGRLQNDSDTSTMT